jgi:hypothetical protein
MSRLGRYGKTKVTRGQDIQQGMHAPIHAVPQIVNIYIGEEAANVHVPNIDGQL